MTVTTTTTIDDACRRSLEVSYVDSMEGRRSLRDVLLQIDGLGPSRRRNRRSDFSSMNKESTPQITPSAEPLFNESTHGEITQFNVRKMLRMKNRGRRHSWPTSQPQKEFSTAKTTIAYLDDAIAIVEGGS
jgi:hypothetical protein